MPVLPSIFPPSLFLMVWESITSGLFVLLLLFHQPFLRGDRIAEEGGWKTRWKEEGRKLEYGKSNNRSRGEKKKDFFYTAMLIDHNHPGLISPVGATYDSVALQQQFSTVSPRDLYQQLCKKLNCKCNGSVTEALSDQPGNFSMEKLVLGRTYVGTKGVIPIIEICKVLSKLTTLDLSDNYLSNEAVGFFLAKMAASHPSLTRIVLSKNPISWTAGMSLLELALKNSKLHTLELHQTLIKDGVVEAINAQLRKNAALGLRKQRRGANPSNHPTTIRQRALKRFFKQVCTRGEKGSEDTVPRAMLAEGVKEMWKISGREGEIQQRLPSYFDAVNQRAPADHIDWETFMILVMMENVRYNQRMVSQLRALFKQFDVDGSGYVEAGDLGEMMRMLSGGAVVEPAEVRSKMAAFDLDESMTLSWDELLLLLFDSGPVVGDLPTIHTRTPMPPSKPLHK
jgi:hypothetical protein